MVTVPRTEICLQLTSLGKTLSLNYEKLVTDQRTKVCTDQ